MKKLISPAVLIGMACLFSCNNGKTTETVTDTTTVMQTDRMDNSNKMNTVDTTKGAVPANRSVSAPDVKDFVQEAIRGGMMEVDMGKMAGEHAMSQRVKNFGAMLVSDHTNANTELRNMAMSNDVAVPADVLPEQKSSMNKLMDKKGKSFDKEYMDMMVADHKKDVAAFKKASTDLSDATYKAFASKTLPVLQKHLDSALAIQKSL